MIALRIVPVELADPAAAAKRKDGAGILVPCEGSTAWMEHGEDGAGFYTVQQGIHFMRFRKLFTEYASNEIVTGVRSGTGRYSKCVVCDGSEIVADVGYIKGRLVALMVSHFSTPDDEGDFFVPTPILTPVLEISEMLRGEAA